MFVKDLQNESLKKLTHLKEVLIETRFKCERKEQDLSDLIDSIEFAHILAQSLKSEVERN